MKTLRQFYDSLSEPAKIWIDTHCFYWFDKNEPDCYRKIVIKDKDALYAKLQDKTEFSSYDSSKSLRIIADKYAGLLKYLYTTHPEIISENMLNQCIEEMLQYKAASSDTWLNMSERKLIDGYKQTHFRYSKIDFAKYLYFIKDFDNFEVDLEVSENPTLTAEVVEIIGIKQAKKIASQLDEFYLAKMVQMGKPNELFDELFFCKDSPLNQAKKMSILRRIYANSNYLPTESIVEDFFNRIVAVDHSYLRFLYDIIAKYPALAMKLYTQKKPDSELTGNETVAETFRYPKEIRKLFVIAHTCALKRVSKVKNGMIKEVAPLLKIYGYKWDDIYDAMYPEDSKLN